MFICMQKINFISDFPIVNLLLWELWECLTISIINHSINLQEAFMLIYRHKINLIFHVFLETMQRYCKIVILGTMGMPCYAHPKWYYQHVENFCVICRQNINSIPRVFLNITKMCKLILGILDMPGHSHQK